jgi:heme-degrading monooxygenase HmoA
VFARVTAISAPAASPEQGLDFFRERVLPDLRSYAGFEEAMLLVSSDGEDVLGISIWDTEEHLRSAEAMPAPHRSRATREALGPQQRRDVRVYEVAFRGQGAGG